ncbi:CapA family protein [candidate division WOR-3 bacterium]|nr:CapA family protein [candidate division WOR-3 bacterium]
MRIRLTLILILGIMSSHADTLSIAAVGDIMMGSTYPVSRLPQDSGRMLFKETAEILKNADIAFGNLEGTLCDGGKSSKDINKGYYFAFRTPTTFGINLKDAGFDVMNLANNHARDFGPYGESSTKKTLESLKIDYLDCDGKIAVFNINGMDIAFIGFYYGSCENSLLNTNSAKIKIKDLSKKYEIVVVSFHGGREGKNALHVRNKPEYYYGESRGNVVEFAHSVIDAGADLVIGHGPHVPRGLEIYNGRLIAYSLGNFCTYKGINVKGVSGYAPLLWVNLHRDGKFLSGKIHSFRQDSETGPERDTEAMVFKLMKKLSREDFPDTSPCFGTTDEIFLKK